ncbi:unnamed protein product, partial [Ilex paraguariensis]
SSLSRKEVIKQENMLGFNSVIHPSLSISSPNPSISRSLTIIRTLNLPSLPFKSRLQQNPRKLSTHAENGKGNNSNGGVNTDTEEREKRENGFNVNNGGREEDVKKEEGNGGPRFNLKWVNLLLDPDPDNILAVGLTGVLAWASLQVLGQLFFISLAILLAALKYSFIAALLIFILITLL